MNKTGFFGLINSPLKLLVIISGIPSTYDAKTGTLHNPASIQTFPSGSRIEGTINKSILLKNAYTSLIRPTNWTLSTLSTLSVNIDMRGPSPAIINLIFSFFRLFMASISTWTPFGVSSRPIKPMKKKFSVFLNKFLLQFEDTLMPLWRTFTLSSEIPNFLFNKILVAFEFARIKFDFKAINLNIKPYFEGKFHAAPLSCAIKFLVGIKNKKNATFKLVRLL